jgi:disulfide bond formation protein DsbB
MVSVGVSSPSAPSRFANRRLIAALVVLVVAFATIAGAWGFELIGHYQPCALCLEERVPYYVGVPVALAAVVAAFAGADRLSRLLLAVAAAVFIWSAYKGVYHAGVEWKWWEGPTTCGVTGTGPRPAGVTLLDQLNIHPPSCTEATWRFPNAEWGLSFAGWNAAISAFLVVVAVAGAAIRRRPAADDLEGT